MPTILVTGANRGIGLEFAKQYAADKAEVIACCRNPAKADKLVKLGVQVMALDTGSPESAARLAEALKGKPIDILINNAGVYGPKKQSAVESDYEGFMETFRINSVGPLMVSQALRANLLAGRDKKLAVLTSKMGSISDSSGGVLAYRASKAALNMIFDGVAKSWARDGVAVAILHPGWVKTDMGGAGAMIEVEDCVRGLRTRIAELSLSNSGRFLDYKGAAIGW